MRVIYHKGALGNPNSIFSYIANDDPNVAERVVSRIRAVTDVLGNSPYLGRPGRREARFLSIAGLPYVIIYRVRSESVRIVAIVHTARNRRF
ncbi:MAG: type II toxin-antitoxin system RelE/ParE family toxin [Pseudolabrys sp.]|jgi:toxin ParE1/3/4